MATTVLGLKTFAASDPVDYNEINDNYTKIDNGVKTALQGRAAHNWLDNSDFSNPVNQRGATSWASSGYTIDRWKTNSAITVNLSSTGITMDATSTSGELQQNVRGLPNGTYTFAALVNGVVRTRVFTNDNGTITNVDNSNASFGGSGYLALGKGSGDYYFQIKTSAGYTNTVAWSALYEGSYTANTLPAYQPKGYAAELAECQRYYWRYWQNNNFDIGHGYMNTTDTANITFDFPTKMRITPTITIGDISTLRVMCVNGLKGATAYSVVKTTDKQMMVGFTLDSTSTAFTPCVMRSNSGTTIEFSADL